MKPGAPALRSTRLLDQVRERIRYLHYSLQTEKAELHWVRFFICWHGRNGVMQHPRTLGAAEVEAFLTMLATERQVSASTHNQAPSALLFLYREVPGHSDISTTMIHTPVLKVAAGGPTGPLDALALA